MTRAPLLLLALLAAGCAERDAGRSPSLLPRPIETRSDAEPIAPDAVAIPDPALDAKVADANAALDRSAAAFDAAAGKAQALARSARGAAKGSEAWINAQVALAQLDGLRADASAVATDLEEAAIARGIAGAPEYPSLSTAEQRAKAEVDREAVVIAGLAAALG